jgi:hypothetical protein
MMIKFHTSGQHYCHIGFNNKHTEGCINEHLGLICHGRTTTFLEDH